MILITQKISNYRKYFCRTPLKNEKLTFYEIFKPIQYTLTSVGLFPYSIQYKTSTDRFKIIRNSIYFNSLCAISCLLVMYAFYFLHIEDIYSSDVNTLTNVLITQLNYYLELSTLLLQCTVAYFCAFINRHKYVKILNCFNTIWADVRSDNEDEILANLRFRINVMAMGSIAVIVILQLCVNLTRDDGLWKVILVMFTFVLPQTIQVIGLAFHYVLVMTMIAILASIKHTLFRLNKQEKTPGVLFINVMKSPKFVSLRKMELAYGKAFEMKCDINDAFEAPLLLTVLQSLHCIVSEGYSLYHGWVANTHTLHNLINNSIWTMYQFMKIYSMTRSGNKLKAQALQVGQMLHTIPIEKQELRILMEIQHFASAMQYQEFVLTVYGYFHLDSNLMASIVATITMYLVILVQFDKSSLNTSFQK